MLQRVITIAVSRYVGGPARSWIYSSGIIALYRFLKGRTGKQKVIDLSSSRPGDKFIIEHLPITHGEQQKQLKRAAKDDAKAAKASKQAAKAQRKAERGSRRS